MKSKKKTTTQQKTVQTPNVPESARRELERSRQQIGNLTAGLTPGQIAPGLGPIAQYGINFALGDELGGALQATNNAAAPGQQIGTQNMAAMPPATPQRDYDAYAAQDPGLMREFGRLSRTGFDPDGDGRLTRNEYLDYHYRTFGQGEGRTMPMVPQPTPAPATTQPVAAPQPVQIPSADRPTGLAAISGMAPEPATGAVVDAVPDGSGGFRLAGTGSNVTTSDIYNPENAPDAFGEQGILRRQEPFINEAAGLVRDVVGTTPQVSLTGFDAAQTGSQGYDATGFNAAQMGATGFNPVTGEAAQMDAVQSAPAQGVTADRAQATGFDPVTGAPAQGVQAQMAASQGFDPALAQAAQGQASLRNISDLPALRAAQGAAAQIQQADIDRLMNPQLESVVDAGLSDARVAQEREAARRAAAAAGAGAFGGSRFGVQEAIGRSEDIRNLGNLSAGLRGQAFDRAAGLAAQEAGRRQQINLANLGNRQQAAMAQFGAGVDVLGANQQAANQFGMANLGNRQQIALANQGAQNVAGQFGADAANRAALANQQAGLQADQFSADAANRQAQLNQQFGQQAAQFGADAANRMALANQQAGLQADTFSADAANRMALANQQAGMTAGQANLNALNQFGLANMDAQNQAAQFGAASANEAAARNQAALNQASQFGASAANQAGQFGADAANRAAMQNALFQQQAGQFGADATNREAQLNAALQEQAMGRGLQGAGMLANLGAQASGAGRADLGTILGLGQLQQQNLQQQAMAPLNLAQALAQIQGAQVPGMSLQTGQTTTQNRNTTETSNPGLGQSLLGLGSAALTGGTNPFSGLGGFMTGLFGGGGAAAVPAAIPAVATRPLAPPMM